MKRLLVLGFYGKGNLGDEMFQETLPLLVPDFNCDFIATDDFKDDINKYDAIICGAGDIFNEYFMSKIKKILSSCDCKIPKFIVGMGIPHLSMFQTDYLSLFDHVFLRETTDLPILTRKIGGRYAHSLPDVAFLKTPLRPLFPSPYGEGKEDEKIIAVFLAQPMRVKNGYLDSTIQLLEHASKFGKLKFIRFNYSENAKEDDQFIQNDVQQCLLNKGIIVDNDLSIYTSDQVIKMMTKFQFAICARFHSHIYATIAGCPFISIATTRKVELFLKEEGLDIALHDNFIRDPCERFNQVWEQKFEFSNRLQFITRRNHESLQTKQINNLLLQKSCRPKDVNKLDRNVIYETAKKLIEKNPAKEVAAYICYQITKSPGSKYEWGTTKNIKENPEKLMDMIDWLIDDVNKEKLKEFPKLDLDFYNQNDLNGLHRAGWQYVLTYLRSLNTNQGVICDTFMDRTFIWGRWALSNAGIIPYTNLWIGFVHHTPNREYTDNNCWEMIRSKEFLQSLPTCKGIFCLSEYLATWFREQFNKLQVDIPVITLFHPTLFVNMKWSFNFPSIEGKLKEINLINIGAWYRNPFSIYQIQVPSHVKKMTLKGPKMDDYFPLSFELTKSQIWNPDRNGNKWTYYLYRYLQGIVDPVYFDSIKDGLKEKIQKMITSVSIIEKLENDEYDRLLTNSIVFLHLIDVSAANTVIECIVRETPVLVNRHPALEEYLGKDYPLFYDNFDQVYDLLQTDKIIGAHQYLKNMDKEFLKIENFLSEIVQSNIYQNLY